MKMIKVYSLFRKHRWSASIYPQIKLTGRWLHEAGFTAGSTVRVNVQDKKLIIEVVQQKKSSYEL